MLLSLAFLSDHSWTVRPFQHLVAYNGLRLQTLRVMFPGLTKILELSSALQWFHHHEIVVLKINVPIDLDSPMALKKLFESPTNLPLPK